MKLALSLLLYLSLTGLPSFGQNTGLYGKKLAVSLDVNGSYPLFSMSQTGYKDNNGTLTLGSDNFDYGFTASVSYALINNFAMGFEFGMDFSNAAAPEYINSYDVDGYYYETYQIKHEFLKTVTKTYIPKFEFTSKTGLLPIGLNHQLGIGYTTTKVKRDDYNYVIYPSGNMYQPDTTNFAERFYDYDGNVFKGLVLLYALNIRTPVNKRLMISYGVRYTFNMLYSNMIFDNYVNSSNQNKYIYTKNDSFYSIKRRRNRSFISVNVGLAIAI